MKGIAEIKSTGLGCFPCYQRKNPMIDKWKENAFLPEDKLPKSNIWGLLVPPRILIIDLDLYKTNVKLNRKITREDADKALNCKLPWDQSLIQNTQSGGEHHAFLVDSVDYPENMKQQNGTLLEGLDTKVAGKGYICFGENYTEMGSGIIGLSNPDGFPRLPDAAYDVLKRDKHQHDLPPPVPTMKAERDNHEHPPSIRNTDLDNSWIKEALAKIPPNCSWEDWRNVGFALKNGFGNDPEGFELWDQWSRGDFHGNDIPEKYIEQDMFKIWDKFKQYVPGGITIYSIFRTAKMNRFRPMKMDAICEVLGKCEQVDQSKHPGNVIIHVDKIPPWQIADRPTEGKKKTRFSDEECVFEIFKGPYGDRFKDFNGTPRWWSGREWEYIGKKDLNNFLFDSLPKRYRDMNRVNQIREAFLCRMPDTGILKPSKKVFFLDGVLDLYSGEFVQHKKNNHNIGTLPINYKDKTGIIEWLKFLHSTLEEDEIRKLQEIMGFYLVHHNLGIEKFIAFTGATRAGKGIILRILTAILGSGFCESFNFDMVGTPQGHDALWQYQVLIDPEAKAPKREEKVSTLQTIQKVTSNERISSKRLYENQYKNGIVNCKLIIACNNLPIFSDDSGASASRIEILKFSKSFLGKEDFNLYERLEKELPGIAHWAIEGLQRLIANNGAFTKSKSSIKEMKDLENLSKPLNPFIENYLIFDHAYSVSIKDLYAAYKQYCGDNKMRIWSEIMFRKKLEATLLSKNLDWCQYRENGVKIRGVKGVKIIDSVFIPGVSPSSAPLPPTPMVDQS